jgi:O-antigen/teichoic acid export membrane protein
VFDKIKKLVSHTLIYGLGNAGNRFVGFFLIPLYSRYLAPEDYGVLALVGMLGQVLFIVASIGEGPALFRTYFLYDDPAGRQRVISTSLWLILIFSLPLCFVALSLSQPLGALLIGSSDYTLWVVIGIGGVMIKILLRMPLSVLRAREESHRYALSMFVDTVASIALVILFVVSFHLGGQGVILGQALGDLLICCYLLIVTLKGLKLEFSTNDARDMLGYGVYLIPSGLFSFLLHLSDRYFLKYYASLSAVGIYALGYRMGEILSFALQAFGLAWPQFLFGNRKSPQAPALYARTFTYYAMVIGTLWLVVSLLAPEVTKIMVHPSYYEAHRVVPWVAAAFLFQGLGSIGGVGITLHKKVKYRPAILATTAALNVGLNFVLIPRYGMMGAAVASFVSLVFQAFFRLLVSYRLYPVPYEYARLTRLTVVLLGLYGVGTLVAWGSLWVALAGKVLLLLCAPFCLYASGFLQSNEVTQLRRSFGSLRQRAGTFLQARGLSD